MKWWIDAFFYFWMHRVEYNYCQKCGAKWGRESFCEKCAFRKPPSTQETVLLMLCSFGALTFLYFFGHKFKD